MKTGSCLDLLAPLGEDHALAGDFLFEVLDGGDVLVDDRLVDERPQGFGRLQLRSVGRQINEPNAIGDFQIGCAMPSGIVEHEQNDASNAGLGFACEGFEQRLEERLRHAVGKVPEGFAGGRRCESRDVKPVETMMAMRDRTLADGRPHTSRDRLTWAGSGQGVRFSGAGIKLQWLSRYPRSEPVSVTWSFPHQIKLTSGRRAKRLHQYPACGGVRHRKTRP